MDDDSSLKAVGTSEKGLIVTESNDPGSQHLVLFKGKININGALIIQVCNEH
jgi:hypothetical protein